MTAVLRGTRGAAMLARPWRTVRWNAGVDVDPALVRAVQRGESSFGTWLHGVAVEACCTALTRRGAELADLAQRAASALAALPEDARDVVVLRDAQGLSTKETAQMLGISEGAAKVRLHRAHVLRELVVQ